MHFSIPDAQQCHEDNGTFYMGYNIYINGFYHCTCRYKQLLSLHEQLCNRNPFIHLPAFPPKKIFLTTTQLRERRVLLEKYLQHIGQNNTLANSDIMLAFLFSAQQETHAVPTHKVDLEIFLMNGYRIPIDVSSTDSSQTVLDVACNCISLPKDLIKYFSLYLFNWSCAKSGQPALKKLEEYESPYISQKYVRPEDKVVLRKSYWDPCYDLDLMIDRGSLDLLYLQLVAEMDLGWLTASPSIRENLALYESTKQKREYIELARTLRHYGRIPVGEALAEGVSIPGTRNPCRVRVSVAGKELTLATLGQPTREQRFKVTRMRCWRITTLHVDGNESIGRDGPEDSACDSKNMELSFEYLVSKDNLDWVTLRTEHATHISVMLQSMVEELMRQKSGAGLSESVSRNKHTALTYLRRDGSSQIITPSSSTDTLSSGNGDSVTSGSSKQMFSVHKLAEKFASVAFKSGKDCVENNAFEGIGDEDL